LAEIGISQKLFSSTMTAMSVLYVEYMKDLFSSTLILKPETTKEFEKILIDIPYREIIFDFSGIRSMSKEFAKEYLSIKCRSKKIIHEVNVPLNVRPVMDNVLISQ
jgi:hypothetical protein